MAKQSHGEHNQAAQGSPGARKAPRTAAAMRDIAAPAAYGAHGSDRVAPPTPRAMPTDLPPSGDLRRLTSQPLLHNFDFPHPCPAGELPLRHPQLTKSESLLPYGTRTAARSYLAVQG